jgi:hypothetical protein
MMSMLERSSSSIEMSNEARFSSDGQFEYLGEVHFKSVNASSNFVANLESG